MAPRPTEPCKVKDARGLNKEDESGGIHWLGAPLARAEVERLFPDRPLLGGSGAGAPSAEQLRKAATAERREREADQSEFHPTAVAHFWGARVDGLRDEDPVTDVYLGDYVTVDVGDRVCLCQVEELYQDVAGRRMMRVHWYYSVRDRECELVIATKVAKTPEEIAEEEAMAEADTQAGGKRRRARTLKTKEVLSLGPLQGVIDERMVFRAADNDTYHHEVTIASINEKNPKPVVVQLAPGALPPPPGEADFWWEKEVNRCFLTFRSVLLGDSPPTKWLRGTPGRRRLAVPLRARAQAAAEVARAGGGAGADGGRRRLLRVMDVYAGAGGLGYLDLVSPGIEIRTDWAIDFEDDMARTFKCNNQHTHVMRSGADEWLCLCQDVFSLWKELFGDDPAGWRRREELWDGRPYKRTRDDEMIAFPRSVVMEMRGKSRHGGRKPAADGGATAATAGPAAAAAAVEPEQTEDSEEDESSESESEESEEEEEEGPSRKRARGASGGSAPATSGKETAAKKKDVVVDVHLGEEDKLPSAGPPGRVLSIEQVRLAECGLRNGGASVSNGHLVRALAPDERWLEFRVRCEGMKAGDAGVWVRREQLPPAARPKLKAFLQRLRERQVIPFPGEVNLLCGGPPCQGVSGNNRHAQKQDILTDPRNRQLTVFMAMVEHFKPEFVLMENVQDILKKEDGAYQKFALGFLLQHRYQARVGMIAAGNFGVAQGRWRVFVWGAAPWEQLPALPAPTHFCRDFNCPVASKATGYTVGFPSEQAARVAHKAVLIGDILDDLPSVSNEELMDRCRYASDPLYIPSAWLRRAPAPWQTPLADRLRYQEEWMLAQVSEVNAKMVEHGREDVVKLGKWFMCDKHPLVPFKPKGNERRKRQDGADQGCVAFETYDAFIRTLKDPEVQAAVQLEFWSSRQGWAHTEGRRMLAQLEGYEERLQALLDDPQAVLTCHRSICCNSDDRLRIESVPARTSLEECNYRNMPGVVINSSTGKACAGHSHEARTKSRGKTTCGCGAGGTFDAPEGGLKDVADHKELRIDFRDMEGWRGVALEGCDSYTVFLPTGDLLVPRWPITFKGGKSDGRGGCFGRVHRQELMATVVGRAEPHNLKLAHPEQNRVLTIREMARMQGFPDHHVLVAGVNKNQRHRTSWVRNLNLTQRYQQMGNAVCPEVASALGRCLAVAAVGETPDNTFLLRVPNPDYEALVAKERRKPQGLRFYLEAMGLRMGVAGAPGVDIPTRSSVVANLPEIEDEVLPPEDEETEEEEQPTAGAAAAGAARGRGGRARAPAGAAARAAADGESDDEDLVSAEEGPAEQAGEEEQEGVMVVDGESDADQEAMALESSEEYAPSGEEESSSDSGDEWKEEEGSETDAGEDEDGSVYEDAE